jgi:hypothetical protein
MSRLAAALTVAWRSLVESPSAIGGETAAIPARRTIQTEQAEIVGSRRFVIADFSLVSQSSHHMLRIMDFYLSAPVGTLMLSVATALAESRRSA